MGISDFNPSGRIDLRVRGGVASVSVLTNDEDIEVIGKVVHKAGYRTNVSAAFDPGEVAADDDQDSSPASAWTRGEASMSVDRASPYSQCCASERAGLGAVSAFHLGLRVHRRMGAYIRTVGIARAIALIPDSTNPKEA